MLMSVSMVVAPWRRFTHVARWNGQAPHTTTGDASANASHIHSSNCSAGIIDSAITGMASAAVITSRWRAWSTGSVWSCVAAMAACVARVAVARRSARAGAPRSRGSRRRRRARRG